MHDDDYVDYDDEEFVDELFSSTNDNEEPDDEDKWHSLHDNDEPEEDGANIDLDAHRKGW